MDQKAPQNGEFIEDAGVIINVARTPRGVDLEIIENAEKDNAELHRVARLCMTTQFAHLLAQLLHRQADINAHH